MKTFKTFIAEQISAKAGEKFPHLTSVAYGCMSQNSGGQRHHARDYLERSKQHHELYHKAEAELVKKHNGDHTKLYHIGADMEGEGKQTKIKHVQKAINTMY